MGQSHFRQGHEAPDYETAFASVVPLVYDILYMVWGVPHYLYCSVFIL